MTALRVLLVATEYTTKFGGGVGAYVYELATELARAGCEVVVLTHAPDKASITREPNLTVHAVPPSREAFARGARGPLASSVKMVLAVNEELLAYAEDALRSFQPDIVHFNHWSTCAAGRALAARARVPAVGTSHAVAEPIERTWGETPHPEVIEQERIFYDGTSHVIAVSSFVASLIVQTYALDQEHMTVIHPGLRPDHFLGPAPTGATLEKLRGAVAEPHEKIVFFVGRLHPQKGVPAIFEAADHVIARHPNVKYLLAGGRETRESAEGTDALMRRYEHLRGRIQLLGKLPRKQVALLHRIADVALVPSIHEAFGYTAIEAMAAGVPVIGADSGGLREILEHGRTGLLIPIHMHPDGVYSADAEMLAVAQLALLEDPALSRRIGQAGRDHVTAAFDMREKARAHVALYRDLIAVHGYGSPSKNGTI